MIKQRGGMLAKGRLLGIQFQTLFEDGLYWQISRHAIDMAMKLKKAFQACGYGFYVENSTNQQLPVLPDAVLEKLAGKYSYSFWRKQMRAIVPCDSAQAGLQRKKMWMP